MTTNLDKQLIQRIQEIGLNYSIDKIILFGSRARGDHHLTSDIDLAIYPLPGFEKRGELASDLDDLRTLLKIDTVFIDSQIDLQLLGNIRREGVTLYERSKSKVL